MAFNCWGYDRNVREYRLEFFLVHVGSCDIDERIQQAAFIFVELRLVGGW